MPASTIQVEIKRQSTPGQPAATEKFSVPYRPGMNITSLLGEIAMNPVTVDGKATTPITYDSNCLEEICGSCAMLINGKARMACSALVDKLEQPIRLAPLSKFPVVRDLSGGPVRTVREPEGGKGVGADRRHLRSGRRAAAAPADPGAAVSAFELHLLLLLHGGLPTVQRVDELRRCGDDRAGQDSSTWTRRDRC